MYVFTVHRQQPKVTAFLMWRSQLSVILLAVLICALGGTFFIEQPGGSYMEFYDKMEWLYARLPAPWHICNKQHVQNV